MNVFADASPWSVAPPPGRRRPGTGAGAKVASSGDRILGMMAYRILISVACALGTYLLLNLFFGPNGLVAYQDLRGYHDRLEENVSEMQTLQARLERRSQALQESEAAVRLEARELGYFSESEQPVLIEGYEPDSRAIPAGTLLQPPSEGPDRTPLFRGVALSTGLAVFFLLLL